MHRSLNILVVEDVEQTLELMADYLRYEYPEAQIHTATTVDEAIARIDGAAELGIKFDVVVLDFLLPRHRGGQPELDLDWRERLAAVTSSGSVVFHISAYTNDSRIVSHLQAEPLKHPRIPNLAISKVDHEIWTDKLFVSISRVIHGNRIEQQMDRLFGRTGAGTRGDAAYSFGSPSLGDPTHDLAALIRDIEAHWDVLDVNLQNRVREVFSVRQEGMTMVVSLFGDSGE